MPLVQVLFSVTVKDQLHEKKTSRASEVRRVVNYEDLLSGTTAEIPAQGDLTEDQRFYNEGGERKKGGSAQGYTMSFNTWSWL